METTVRLMTCSEAELIIEYFHGSSAEHLETLGVDPTRLPSADVWRQRLEREFTLPLEQRTNLLVIWLLDQEPVGFSTADTIVFGERAKMHLHVTRPELRNAGIGLKCVRDSVDLYFTTGCA